MAGENMNSIKVNKTFGSDIYEIKVESDSVLECVQKISVFSEVQKCGCCQGENLFISYRKVNPKEGKNAGKSFEYYDFVCRDCGAKANIGMYQTGGIFLKKFEKYERPGNENTENPNTAPAVQVATGNVNAAAPAWAKETNAPVAAPKYGNTPSKF
jgi:hypothetical protein